MVPMAEKMRATNFNFDCVTRWLPCVDEEDVMPVAAAEYAALVTAKKFQDERLEKCDYSLGDLSRASLNAVVVSIEALPGRDGQDAKVRIAKQLGGPVVLSKETPFGFVAYHDGRQVPMIVDAFRNRQELIVLFGTAPENGRLASYPCGLLRDSDAVEKEVMKGISAGMGRPEY